MEDEPRVKSARNPANGSRADFERGPLPARRDGADRPRAEAEPAGSPAPGAGRRYFGSRGAGFIEDPHDRRMFEATRALVVAARMWRKFANDKIKRLNQTMARWETLFHVAVGDDRLSQRELASLMGVEGPTMVRMLDRLSRDGLIERRQNAGDRRVTNNQITPAGTEAVRRIMALTNEIRADVLRDIDPERLAVCVDVLEEIIERLDRKD